MILMPDLFSFAYVPNWYSQLDMLAEMALPEPWRFKNPRYLTKNPDTPILERYIHAIFKKQLIDYKEERIPGSAAKYFHIENEFCCFHTGLYTGVIRQSMPAWTGIKRKILCWNGISGALRMNCHLCSGIFPLCRKSLATI